MRGELHIKPSEIFEKKNIEKNKSLHYLLPKIKNSNKDPKNTQQNSKNRTFFWSTLPLNYQNLFFLAKQCIRKRCVSQPICASYGDLLN